MNRFLNRYWIKTSEYGNEFGGGIGITAYSKEDVNAILKLKIEKQIKIVSIEIIHSIDELEQNHVVANMEEFVSRGIWFPKGFK